jgi:predicted  nucleic acid-binding Zn-ribbon protein
MDDQHTTATVQGPSGNSEATPEAVSATRAALQDAIRKVMDKIEHHEREAQHHLQQAAALRKDLRESMSYLQQEAKKVTPSPSATPGDEEKSKDSRSGKRHGGGKKKK